MTEEKISPPVPTAEEEEKKVELKRNEAIACSFTIALVFVFFSGIFVGLAGGFVTYYYATHGKTLLRSAIYGILTGVIGSIIIIIGTLLIMLI